MLTVELIIPAIVLAATETPSVEVDSMVTIWPLFDYRENHARKTSKLSILGPILTFERTPDDQITAFRPLFYTEEDSHFTRTATTYLYPLASAEITPDVTRMELLQLFQQNTFRKAEPVEKEQQSMLFPLYISGESKKYGSYTSIFPIYGDIYERFWRDEYHYTLFPVYGRTVNKGTTNYHFLWPFFSIIKGVDETGFEFWPLYGQASKEGVYKSSFTLWPIFLKEERGLDTAEPSQRFIFFPLYASFDSPTVTSRTWLWPFFGYSSDTKNHEEERDYLWPFWLTVTGDKRNVVRFLPFYSDESTEDSTKNWYLWPIFKNDTMQSPHYRQVRDTILFFLYSNRVESWAQDDKERQRIALWPLFLYRSDTSGEKILTLPAPVEPVLEQEGIEKSWAPLWRIYVQKWNDQGDSALSIFWNLYWHDKNKDSFGFELFPLLRHRSTAVFSEVQILKGLLNYQKRCNHSSLSILWTPFTIDWQNSSARCESNN